MRVQDAKGGTALGALGRSIGHLGADGGEAPVLPVLHHVTWFQNGGVRLTAGIQIDGLAVMMMFVVTLISLLVHVYSLEYMRGDRRFTYFYAALSLFTASMLLLVVADNTLQLLVGWELVGVCSFMLIGHWWEEKPNSDAALKAFLTTRTGDIGLLTGVIMTFFVVQRATGVGSFNIVALNSAASNPKVGHTLILWTAAALMLAIVGKSGQFPLHTWLPDAMAGPTPVSALIHAATMVVAGVYLGARVYPVFFNGFSIGDGGINPMAAIGGITVLDRGRARVRAGRHQEGARVLHHQPARLHGDGARRRRVDRGRVPPLHARVLQGRPLPRRRFGEPLGFAPLLRHEEGHGRPEEVHAADVQDLRDRHARARRDLPARGLLVEGRDPRQRRPQRLQAVPRRRPRSVRS